MRNLLLGAVLLLAGLLMGRFWCLVAVGWLLSKAVERLQAWRRHRKLVRQLKALGAYGGTIRLENGETAPEEEAKLSAEPDSPVPFGYKTTWLAVRCGDPERIISELEPGSRQPANWITGLAAARRNGQVFVSPALDEFVLVIGAEDLLGEWDDQRPLDAFSSQFLEVQFFASHRISDFYLWGRYRNGVRAREYCWEEGEACRRNIGPLTPEELDLGFAAFPCSNDDSSGELFPGEEDVLNIAAAWGVDPRFEKKTYPPSTGWVCTL
ncbi:hypothetical protein SAMN05216343_105133 [Oscillibacter sp. PC13]|uniref:hypothetical protein n=1 Tax=Oscillibacter sp. PC13 TaxID=1855299 RepID=UPI0008DF3851|nr:hypothetical protein [Oscillibacter sp. PC13]SFP29434.1 hypothetical protein SAMN05216343_105133 [Oscillibacter sp. PC13]